jgi:methyl-accepting chemotaxis protein
MLYLLEYKISEVGEKVESSALKFSIAKKMFIFGVGVFVIILVMAVFKFNTVLNADKNFDIFKEKAVNGKFLALDIEKELNLMDSSVKNIFLGNSYDENLANILKNKENIEKLFEELYLSFKGTFNQDKKLKETIDSKEKTFALLNQILVDIKSLKDLNKTPEVLSLMYKQHLEKTENLSKLSKEAFDIIIKTKNNGLNIRTKAYHEEMTSLKNFIFIESFIILFIIISALFILTKDIVGSLNKFKHGLNAFFDFLNRKNENIELIDIKSSDEFGQMANLINENVKNIQNNLEEDKKLIDDASIVISRVKHGWYSQLIEEKTSNKTLAILKDGINDMIKSTKQHFVTINETLEEYAKYNYINELKLDNIEKGGVFELLITDINKLRSAINLMLQENKRNGLTLNESSNILLSNVAKLNQSSNDAAARLEETAAALEEVTSSISNSTLKISEMAQISNNVTTSANQGEKLASKTTNAMEEINQKVEAINEAISVIDQIAFQTNILSLNAAVEAATAGEAGKGFAVVAAEVRNLASRSAEAAREIKNLVQDATVKADEGKEISNEMIKGYSLLNEKINQTISLISEITTSSKEQQKGVEQINDAINSLDKQTQENALVANMTNDIAKKTSRIAKKIVESADEKEFEGKNSIKIEDTRIEKEISNENISKTNKAISNQKVEKIQAIKNKEDDEWESF